MTSEPRELELTPDLLEYAKAVALRLAPDHCKPRLARPTAAKSDLDERPWADLVQEVILQLLRRPPRYDPARGASPKTLIYTIVQRAVMKFVAREVRHASRHKQVVTPQTGDDDDREAALEAFSLNEQVERRRKQLLSEVQASEDIFEFIDSEESRTLCRLFIEFNGNRSAVADRLGLTEGAVRHRLKMLAPKLRAAGFDPFEGGA